jgi:hypothetical protein
MQQRKGLFSSASLPSNEPAPTGYHVLWWRFAYGISPSNLIFNSRAIAEQTILRQLVDASVNDRNG